MKARLVSNLKKAVGKPSLPNFMIIGAQKAGTSSLHSYLNYHPQLKGSYPKEVHFFDHPEKWESGLAEYQNNFMRPFWDKRKYYESTPNYLYQAKAPEFIKGLKPEMKFIVIERDPVERAYSAWNMFRSNTEKMQKNGDDIPDYYKIYLKPSGEFMSFEEVINEELRRIESREHYDNEYFTLLRKGNYKEQLNQWMKYFPKEQFYNADFSDFVKDPLKILNEISGFLNIADFNNLDLDLKPRNQREYEMEISEDLKMKINDFLNLS